MMQSMTTLQHPAQDAYMAEATILSEWQPHADRIIKQLAATGQPFTSDDVRRQLPHGITPHTPNAYGGLFQAWKRLGLIHPIGYALSTHPARHGGVIRQWVGTRA